MSETVSVERIGREGEPLVVIDGFAPDPDALRTAAREAVFEPAGEHYPGIRAPLPPDYLHGRLPLIARQIGRHFARCRRVHVVNASFSIVTAPPTALTVKQRLPHVDAFGAGRIALIHYLSPEGGDGTAFFRHRATGFETVSDDRAPAYFDALSAELADSPPPLAYVADDTPLFERTLAAEARFNRALLYRSYLLHSGAIAPDAALSPDPATGRLTITAFFQIE